MHACMHVCVCVCILVTGFLKDERSNTNERHCEESYSRTVATDVARAQILGILSVCIVFCFHCRSSLEKMFGCFSHVEGQVQ